MWPAAHNRCWTADRLAKRGLPHPDQCILCDQEEDIQHLLVGCVFSRDFWFSLLSRFGFAALAPQPSDQSFDNWWRKFDCAVSGDFRLGLNSLVILGAWSIWRHRNDCVFNQALPNVNLALALARGRLLGGVWQEPREFPCSLPKVQSDELLFGRSLFFQPVLVVGTETLHLLPSPSPLLQGRRRALSYFSTHT
jgi:hypothetical protein